MNATATMLLDAATTPRRHDLDWLRVIALALLIFYHVGMVYVTWDFHIKSAHAGPLIEPAMLAVNPWRLMLLFFISGVALRFALARVALRQFLLRRTLRLFVPIVFGMVVVVMPQAYVELLWKGEIEPDFATFYLSYLSPRQEFSIITPTWNHLWYVVYIMVYTLAVAAMLPALRRLDGPSQRLFSWLAASPWGLLTLPALPFLAYRLLLDPIFPTTHTLIDDWATHAHALTIFVFGYLCARSAAFWHGVDRTLGRALALAATLGFVLLWLRLNATTSDRMLLEAVPGLRVFYAWAVIMALLGLAQRHLDKPGRALDYLNQAIFPCYILHQTLIIVIGYALLACALPAWVEAALVTFGTVAGCVVLYEIVRRIALVRPLFGLPYRSASGQRRATVWLPVPRG
ncbi:acyltransferase family protein [Aminobacter sp. HY435]|uniref:acyltransferase family protein n=1 Tax=Aminobacter sp. HY435 TaxID=2970917 RepID=UPI0022B968C2|nr:acyltransferase family protein [Aminobacter sp. HY435]